ncbi:MAG: hypothetical protein AB7K24_26790 [Gemmataceae bacterium]
MRSKAWIALLQTIPPEKFEKLTMVSSSGNELNIQNILRIEEEYMVCMGRLAGTTDDPRVMLVPLDNIDYLGFREPLKQGEAEEIFGHGLGLDGQGAPAPRTVVATPAAAAAAAAPSEEAAEDEPVKKQKPAALSALLKPQGQEAPAPAPTPPPAPAPAPAAEPAAAEGGPLLPGKAALLERLRKSRQGQ